MVPERRHIFRRGNLRVTGCPCQLAIYSDLAASNRELALRYRPRPVPSTRRLDRHPVVRTMESFAMSASDAVPVRQRYLHHVRWRDRREFPEWTDSCSVNLIALLSRLMRIC